MTVFYPLPHHSFQVQHLWKLLLPVVLALLFFFLLASPAKGQVMVEESHLSGHVPDWVDRTYYRPPPPVCYQPVKTVRVWAEPVYRTVTDRVWVPPVTQHVCERIWVEARYELRTISTCECGQSVTKQVLVLVQPGHYDNRDREVVACPGHWQTITRQELVCAGHYVVGNAER